MKVLHNGKAVEKVDPPAVGGAEAMREAAAKATITRLSAELEAARECLERLASLVPFPTPDELGFIHPQVTARAEFARAVLAKLSKGE